MFHPTHETDVSKCAESHSHTQEVASHWTAGPKHSQCAQNGGGAAGTRRRVSLLPCVPATPPGLQAGTPWPPPRVLLVSTLSPCHSPLGTEHQHCQAGPSPEPHGAPMPSDPRAWPSAILGRNLLLVCDGVARPGLCRWPGGCGAGLGLLLRDACGHSSHKIPLTVHLVSPGAPSQHRCLCLCWPLEDPRHLSQVSQAPRTPRSSSKFSEAGWQVAPGLPRLPQEALGCRDGWPQLPRGGEDGQVGNRRRTASKPHLSCEGH